MLHQSKSSVLSRALKITTVILLFGGIFVFSSYKDLKEPLIVVIDVGHGGVDSGNISYNVNEKDIILNISKQLALLSNDDVKLIMTREDDEFTSLTDRINFINTQNPDLVVSLHCNANSDESTNGVEAYYNDKNKFKDKSYEYGKILVDKQTKLFSNNRGVKTANLYVLREVNSPGVTLELGFLTNEHDKIILSNSEKQKEIAESIFDGLEEIRSNK